jgi:hypothetical protein
MKLGRSLTELAQEIERQATAKRDFVADTRQLSMEPDGRTLTLDGQGSFVTRDLALQQIATHTGVPVPYVRRMQAEAPDLLAANVNRWLQDKPAPRMVRTLDNEIRAFLSNRYARIDNLEVAETVLPVLQEVGARTGGMELVSCEITENRLYLKALFPKVQGVVTSRQVGDIVQAGVLISNSEVGLGAVSVKAFSMRLVCLNGMTRDGGGNWKHVGRRITQEDEIYELLTDEAKQADDRALLLKVRDTVAATVDQSRFDKWLARMSDAATQTVEGDVPAAIETLGKTAGLRQDEQSSVLRHLIEGGDLSRWGVANAVTRAANDVESYDRATELEGLGGKIIDLSAHEWRTIATAKPHGVKDGMARAA